MKGWRCTLDKPDHKVYRHREQPTASVAFAHGCWTACVDGKLDADLPVFPDRDAAMAYVEKALAT